ncbi:Gfo/Idh/MocA family protein [Sporolactobacillus inulinus]|uniref:Possible oxidoreductase n=2 Tax=Sporolactobacillus inulinus TaxID=2078 RepID=A0A4Y3T4N3_9BACL|nr:Gfo/Idh/MocA family oxidoreductase [Sporolactobacillus inulinus]KLI02810.1 oxidoreductase [Sporolactobacillus inulinus CASD]GAY76922.1 possible oxidoreductase [Sporolactobacillus inulinus]GEB77136.1 oxidoreductase [Sporolactobacillus inulinus]
MRLATIGTSKITQQFVEAIKKTGRFDYVGAYSRSGEKAKQFANRFGAHLAFSSLEQLAGSNAVDVVYCASPNSVHFEQVVTLLKGGKHVLCEKPIFVNLKEFDEAVRIADAQDVYLIEAIRNIQTPVFKKLKQELPRAGQIRSAVLQLIQYSSRYDRFKQGEITNIFSPQFAGGALEDLGIYPLYVAVALFGEPQDAVYNPVRLANGIDGSGTLVLRYPDFVCTVLCSKIAHSDAPSEIHGEEGTFRFNNPSTIERLEWIDAHEKQVTPVAKHFVADDKIFEISRFADLIEQRDREAYLNLRALSRSVLRTMETARKQCGLLFPSDHASR